MLLQACGAAATEAAMTSVFSPSAACCLGAEWAACTLCVLLPISEQCGCGVQMWCRDALCTNWIGMATSCAT